MCDFRTGHIGAHLRLVDSAALDDTTEDAKRVRIAFITAASARNACGDKIAMQMGFGGSAVSVCLTVVRRPCMPVTPIDQSKQDIDRNEAARALTWVDDTTEYESGVRLPPTSAAAGMHGTCSCALANTISTRKFKRNFLILWS